jgi:hypothetical protein
MGSNMNQTHTANRLSKFSFSRPYFSTVAFRNHLGFSSRSGHERLPWSGRLCEDGNTGSRPNKSRLESNQSAGAGRVVDNAPLLAVFFVIACGKPGAGPAEQPAREPERGQWQEHLARTLRARKALDDDRVAELSSFITNFGQPGDRQGCVSLNSSFDPDCLNVFLVKTADLPSLRDECG